MFSNWNKKKKTFSAQKYCRFKTTSESEAYVSHFTPVDNVCKTWAIQTVKLRLMFTEQSCFDLCCCHGYDKNCVGSM